MACVVFGCGARAYRTRKEGNNVLYHRFPKDPGLQKVWLNKCRRLKSDLNFDSAKVCSKHFSEDNYMRDLKAELLGSKKRVLLKPEAVPNLELPVEDSVKEKRTTKNSMKSNKRNLSTIIEEAQQTLNEPLIKKPKPSKQSRHSNSNGSNDILREAMKTLDQPEIFTKNKDISTQTDSKCDNDVRLMICEKTHEARIATLNDTCTKLRAKNKLLVMKTVALRSKLKQENEKIIIKQEVSNILGSIFSDAQIKVLTNGKSHKPRWGPEDLIRGLALRSMTKKRVYAHLRENLGYPLPSNTTLNRFRKTISSNTSNSENAEQSIVDCDEASMSDGEESDDTNQIESETEQSVEDMGQSENDDEQAVEDVGPSVNDDKQAVEDVLLRVNVKKEYFEDLIKFD